MVINNMISNMLRKNLKIYNYDMKYLKRHKLITEEVDEIIEVDDKDVNSITELEERFEELEDEINDFDRRKSKLESVVMNNKENKDISKVVEDIVDGNRFLTMYLSVLNKMASAKKLEDRIDYYSQLLKERESDLNLTSNLSNEEEKEEQKEKLNNQIDDIKEKSKDMTKQLEEIEDKIKDDRKHLEEYMDNLKDKFENDLKKLKIDVSNRDELK